MTPLRATRYCAEAPPWERRTLLVYVDDTGSAATEYTDSNVVPNELYAYRVKAIPMPWGSAGSPNLST